VGSMSFIEQIRPILAQGLRKKIISNVAGHELREAQVTYRTHFGCEKAPLSHENTLLGRIYDEIPM